MENLGCVRVYSFHGAELRLDALEAAEQRGQSGGRQFEVERLQRRDQARRGRRRLQLESKCRNASEVEQGR